ncbi:MAG: YdcH family protein [Methylovirgula sp.]
MADKSSDEERAALRAELERLRQEHRDLDAAIVALIEISATDQLQIQRLKKRKLILRDKIDRIEDLLTPDIIA